MQRTRLQTGPLVRFAPSALSTRAAVVHCAKQRLRLGVALRCSEPEQPPGLVKVYRPAFAIVVHDAESTLRIGIALRCSEPKPMSHRLVVLARGGHGVPESAARRSALLQEAVAHGCQARRGATPLYEVQVLGVTSGQQGLYYYLALTLAND